MIKRPSKLAFKDDFQTVSTLQWVAKWGGRSISQIFDPVTNEPIMKWRLAAGAQDYLIRKNSLIDDGRVMVKMRFSAAGALRTNDVAVRIGGTTDNRRAYVARISLGALSIVKCTGTGTGAGLTLSSVSRPELDHREWCWIDFMCVGPNLYATAWPVGQPRPEGWMLSASDAAFTSGEYGFRAAETIDWYCALFSATAIAQP